MSNKSVSFEGVTEFYQRNNNKIERTIEWEKAFEKCVDYEIVKISPKNIIIKYKGERKHIKRCITKDNKEYSSFVYEGKRKYIRPFVNEYVSTILSVYNENELFVI